MITTSLTHWRQLAVIAGLLLLTHQFSAGAEPAAVKPLELRVMTYNLRFASSQPPNSWPERRPLMRELILQLAPDVFGTQEGVYGQLKDLAADLPEYDWIGTGRDGGSRGEFMAIFYKRAEFEPLEYDHFWLSDTPDVIASTTWGNTNRRMVTWVRFRHRSSGREFYFWDTHFDHRIQEAREKAANLVRTRIEKLDLKLPLLLVGDFNAAAEQNKAYDLLTQDSFLTDSWKTAAVRVGEGLSTFNDFKGIDKAGRRIDWILTRGPISVSKTEIVTFQRNGQFPSDHFPLVAQMTLNAKP